MSATTLTGFRLAMHRSAVAKKVTFKKKKRSASTHLSCKAPFFLTITPSGNSARLFSSNCFRCGISFIRVRFRVWAPRLNELPFLLSFFPPFLFVSFSAHSNLKANVKKVKKKKGQKKKKKIKITIESLNI